MVSTPNFVLLQHANNYPTILPPFCTCSTLQPSPGIATYSDTLPLLNQHILEFAHVPRQLVGFVLPVYFNFCMLYARGQVQHANISLDCKMGFPDVLPYAWLGEKTRPTVAVWTDTVKVQRPHVRVGGVQPLKQWMHPWKLLGHT